MSERPEQHEPEVPEVDEAGDAAASLISRAVEGGLSDAEWAELEAAAGKHPGMWRELCLAHRDDLSLRAGVAAMSAALPLQQASVREEDEDQGDGRGAYRLPARAAGWVTTRAWAGWAAAAVFGLVAAAQMSQRAATQPLLMTQPAATSAGNTAGLGSGLGSGLEDALRSLSSRDLLTQYVQNGREQGTVYGVLPERVLLRSTPLADGAGYDVLYVRQIVERAQVPDFYSVVYDEQGNARAIATSPVEVGVEAASRGASPRSGRSGGA